MSKTDELTPQAEQQAEQGTQDGPSEAEQQAEAQAKAEQEQAEALVPLEKKVREDMGRIDRAEALVGSLFTRVGIRIDIGAFRVSGYGRDWRPWAMPLVNRSQSILYKVRNAGAVGRILGLSENARPEDLPGYLTLVPFYAVLKTAKNEQDTRKAHEKIRRAWATLTQDGTFPTQAEAEAKAKAIVDRIKQAQENGTEPSEDDEAPQSGAEAQENDSPAETVRIDPAAVAATRKHLEPFFKQFKDDYGVDENAAKFIMEATLRLTGPDGPGRDLIAAAIS